MSAIDSLTATLVMVVVTASRMHDAVERGLVAGLLERDLGLAVHEARAAGATDDQILDAILLAKETADSPE